MSIESFTSILLTVTLWLSVPALCLLISNGFLHRQFGAAITYRAWLLLPITATAALIGQMQPEFAEQSRSLLPAIGGEAIQTGTAWFAEPTFSMRSALLWVWATGSILAALWLGWLQWQFLKNAGLSRHQSSNIFVGNQPDMGPAVVGLLRPRIILPRDFTERYSALQQAMILRHETLHLAHGDLWVNALLSTWLVLNWFNPIAHLAVARVRRDQELACDAAVLQEFPGQQKSYAEAMLSTQLTVLGLPVGCHWQSSHPLKERLIMLNQKQPTLRKRAISLTLLGLSAALLASLAMAGQIAEPDAEFDVPPSYQSLTPPKYPTTAKDEKVAGRVLMKLEIGTDGKVAQAIVVDSPDARLSESAKTAVKDWVLVPAQKDGQPVSSWVMVPIDFSLDEHKPSATSEPTASHQLDALYVRTP